MKLTKLSLTNFRSFGETQSIDFAPVTLLFGPNSIGKSTVLMALAYLQQILGKGHCDPKYLEALGNKYVGGFKSLVHGRDLKESIKLRVEFEPGLSVGTEYETYIESIEASEYFIQLDDVAGNTKHVGVEFEICWSETHQRAYVLNYRVWLNRVYVGTIYSSDDARRVFIQELNLQHPLLLPLNHSEWLELEGDVDVPRPLNTELFKVLDDLNPNPLFLDLDPVSSGTLTSDYKGIAHIGMMGMKGVGAVPPLNQRLVLNLSGDGADSEEHNDFEVITRALSQAFVAPLDKLLGFLEKSVFIGPLRTIPTPDFEGNPYPSQGDWFDGTAAWDLLDAGTDSGLQAKVSSWFSSPYHLNTGYEVHRSSFHQSFFSHVSDSDLSGMPDDLYSQLEDIFEENSRIVFWDKRAGVELSPNQVGAGLSQVMPLVVAASTVRSGIVSIEQPELHIHPAFQVEVGDLFTQLDVPGSRRPMFLIETHSEHIMLRLLRRIRETTSGELEENVTPVKPEDVSVVYLEALESTDSGAGGVRATRLEIDEDGEFVQRWPAGFFAERRKELM